MQLNQKSSFEATTNKQTSPQKGMGLNRNDLDSTRNGIINIEEKVAQLSLQVNQIIVKPYLQQAFEYVKSSKFDAINAYNQLSDEIAGEVKIISQNVSAATNKFENAQNVITRTQETIRRKYDNSTEEEISTGKLNLEYEYGIVGEHQELSLQLSQEIANYKSRIDSLLSLQNSLDQSVVPFVSRLQLEIDNLELLLHNFDSSDYASVLAKKQGIMSSTTFAERHEFSARADNLTNMLNQFNLNTNITAKPINLETMHRSEDVNNQVIETKKYKPVEKVQQHVEPVNNTNEETTFDDFKGMSRQEIKMVRKLREQQMKFEHMMRMNDMILQYNKSIDAMMQKQRDYEKKYQREEALETATNEESPKKYLTSNSKPTRPVAKKSNSKSIRVVR